MNSIAEYIADFLKKYQPFDCLTFQELSQIALSIKVLNLEKHAVLFKINDVLHDYFYVVASGVIHLSVVADAEEALLNKCHAGDIFGLRPFFAKNNYKMMARVREESIIYAIPLAVFRPFLANNPDVLDFILYSFTTNSSNQGDKENTGGKLIDDNFHNIDNQSDMQYFQSLVYNVKPTMVVSSTTVQDAAQLMTNGLTTAVLVCENSLPIGIVTNTDMCAKIATGRYPITSPLLQIMSSPVFTIFENVSLAEAQLLMLKHNITHLAVTQDGTNKSVVKGLISEHDLVVAQASNPGILIKEIKVTHLHKDLQSIRVRLTDLIQKSILKNIPLSQVQNFASDVNLVLLKRAVELSILELGCPPSRYAWLSVGSQGRNEKLLITDQNSMLVFEDVSAEKYREVKDYFLRLGKQTSVILEQIGYTICPNNHVASNTLLCKSLTDWTNQYSNWINTPGENSNPLNSIFFDFEMVIGEKKIKQSIENTIYNNISDKILLFDYLGNEALKNNAPITFFKKFNVEEKGVNKDKFDIKTRGLMPLIDCARLFSLYYNIRESNNTFLRFKQLAFKDSENAEIYLNCANAFLTLSKFRTLEGLKNENSGQYINLQELSKNDKELLKNAFEPMEELEYLIKRKFKLTKFS